MTVHPYGWHMNEACAMIASDVFEGMTLGYY